VRTYTAMLMEKAQAAPTARPKVVMRWLGTDCFIVVALRADGGDFSGLTISLCALARAAAKQPIEPLDRCMVALYAEEIKTDGAGF
jgi:hypothetical protein